MLSAPHRRTIHAKLAPILGEEETDAMLAHFPSTPGEEPVTVAVLDARLAELKAEIIQWTVGSLLAGLSVGMGVAAAVGAAMAG